MIEFQSPGGKQLKVFRFTGARVDAAIRHSPIGNAVLSDLVVVKEKQQLREQSMAIQIY